MKVFLSFCFLFFFERSPALVFGVSPQKRWPLSWSPSQPLTTLEICWLHGLSERGDEIRTAVESFVKMEMSLVPLKVHFSSHCFELKDAFKPLGLVVFDDEKTPASLKRNVLGFYPQNEKSGGHPMTFHVGVWSHSQLVDINLSFFFQDVKPSLQEQVKLLNRDGRLNLIQSMALHEILHGLGIGHEQDREDSSCPSLLQKAYKKERFLTDEYDPESLMNYCRTHHFDYNKSPLGLSQGDIKGLRSFLTLPLLRALP